MRIERSGVGLGFGEMGFMDLIEKKTWPKADLRERERCEVWR